MVKGSSAQDIEGGSSAQDIGGGSSAQDIGEGSSAQDIGEGSNIASLPPQVIERNRWSDSEIRDKFKNYSPGEPSKVGGKDSAIIDCYHTFSSSGWILCVGALFEESASCYHRGRFAGSVWGI